LVNYDSTDDFNDADNKIHKRRKRALPLVPIIAGIAGIAVGTTTTMLAQSFQPHLTAMDDAHVAVLRQLATQITSLKINAQQANNVLNNVVDRLQNFEMQILSNFEGVTSITMAMDLKGLNEQLQTISQLTILKYNAALLAAADGRTSPYVLPQRELDHIVQRVQRNKGLTLSHDPATIKTTVTIENNTIVFYFEIPIIDPKKTFDLYTVVPIPVFMNQTYLPNMDSNHIAINIDGDKFTVLNDLQLGACLDRPPRCESYTAITPIRTGISCVATSYISDTQSCPLYQTTSTPLPRFYFFDDVMIYSTPNETTVFITCNQAPGQTTRRDQTLTLTGYGIQQVAPGCSLTLPDGTTHLTPNKAINVTDIGSQLFREIFQRPQPTLDVVYVDNKPIFTSLPRLPSLPDGDFPLLFTDRFTQGFHPATVTANTTQIIVILIVLLIVCAIIYYFRHRFCCCRRPRRDQLDISDPIRNTGQHTGQHWFKEDNEPDTISEFASMPDPPQPTRFSQFRMPLTTFYQSFPTWTRVSAADPDGSQPQPQGPLRRDPNSEISHPSIIRTTPIDGPTETTSYRKMPSHLVQQAVQRREEEKLVRQQEEDRRVSFQPAPSQTVTFH
jgi:hypothetical protein